MNKIGPYIQKPDIGGTFWYRFWGSICLHFQLIIMKCDQKFGCSLKSETALGEGGGPNFYNGINTTTRVFTGTDALRL